jgi:hypothetical protein
MSDKKSDTTQPINKRIITTQKQHINILKRRKKSKISDSNQLEFIDGDLENVDSNNPILRMARSAEKLGLIASRDDIADNFDEILQQVIIESDDD